MAKINTVQGGDDWGKLMRAIDEIERKAVAVGVQEDAGVHKDEDGDSEGVTVAQVAAWNEYGTDTAPERSFFRSTLEEGEKKYVRALNKVVKRTLQGGSAKIAMGKVGTIVQNDIQDKIVNLREPENAESTIKRKKSSNPLIDTGQMLNSIRWVYIGKDIDEERND